MTARRSTIIATPNSVSASTDRNGSGQMQPGAKPNSTTSTTMANGTAHLGGMPRSPPKSNKNTGHVPCKFYLQGQCQAGIACPFSHDVESTTRPTPCKYFAKGGCKFGRKCALLHVTPEGVIVNRNPQPSFGPAPHGYMMPNGPYTQAMPGLLSQQAQALGYRQSGDGASDYDTYQYGARNGSEQAYAEYSPSSPKYGSSPQETRFGASPTQRGLSVLDVPLPNTFDSNGVSNTARNGPIAASVPSRFGLESPAASLPHPSKFGNNTLRNLHSSAFGGDMRLDQVLAGMHSSPPSADDAFTFPKRNIYSDRFRASQPFYSSSLGTHPHPPFDMSEDEDEEDDGGDTDREGDLLPAALHDLIPEGRSRRASRSHEESSAAAHLAASRRNISSSNINGLGTPQDSKVGSPHLGSSPSRYMGMFAARTQSQQSSKDVIGSPLRNAGFSYAQVTSRANTNSQAQTTAFNNTHNNGELSPAISSPPKQSSMSMLTQDFQRPNLDAAMSSTNNPISPQLSPRVQSRSVSSASLASSRGFGMDRGLSSTSVSKIDEEVGEFDADGVFRMDEFGDRPHSISRNISSTGLGIGLGNGNARKDGGDVFGLSTSPWSTRSFANGLGSPTKSNGRTTSGETNGFGAIGSQRK